MKTGVLFFLAILCSLQLRGQQSFIAKQGDNGLWGVVDNTGKTVIPFQYEEFGVKELTNGQMTVPAKKDGLWGLIDFTGGIIIPFQYEDLGIKKELFFYSYFDKGEAAIPVKKDGKWGFIDLMGNAIIPFIYDNTYSYYGLRSTTSAKVCLDGKWGSIDLRGNRVVDLEKKNSYDVPDKNGSLEKNDKNGLYNSIKRQLADSRRACEKKVQEHTLLLAEKKESFESFAKNYVQNRINSWQQKGEFEKTADWQNRVNETTRNEKAKQLLKDAEKEYIAKYSGDLTLNMESYDADNETYLIKSKEYGNLLVSVPQNEAQSFKANWSHYTRTPKYFIENDRLSLAELTFSTTGGKSYKYSNQASLNYSTASIDYNFAPIDIKIADNSNTPKGAQNITEKSVSTGKSGVDINIPAGSKGGNKNTFAVIIANENYQNEAQVMFALNDGETFKKYCLQTLGLPDDNIRFVANATLGNIHGAISWISNVAKVFNGEASIIFYYAGHGIPDESSRTAYLLPVDGYGSDVVTGYKLDDLYATLGALPAKNITVFMDACFSGAQRSGEMLASARGVAIKTSQGKPSGNMVVFSAAQGDETAYPYIKEGHGLFTYFLLKKLQETKGDATLGELSKYVVENVSRQSIIVNKKSQTPMVTPSATMADKWQDVKLK